MADITFTVDAADVDGIVELFEHRYGLRDDLVETKQQFIGRHMRDQVTNFLKNNHAHKAREDDYEAYVPPVIVVS